jgi:hypothetical protein
MAFRLPETGEDGKVNEYAVRMNKHLEKTAGTFQAGMMAMTNFHDTLKRTRPELKIELKDLQSMFTTNFQLENARKRLEERRVKAEQRRVKRLEEFKDLTQLLEDVGTLSLAEIGHRMNPDVPSAMFEAMMFEEMKKSGQTIAQMKEEIVSDIREQLEESKSPGFMEKVDSEEEMVALYEEQAARILTKVGPLPDKVMSMFRRVVRMLADSDWKNSQAFQKEDSESIQEAIATDKQTMQDQVAEFERTGKVPEM